MKEFLTIKHTFENIANSKLGNYIKNQSEQKYLDWFVFSIPTSICRNP